MKKNLPRMRHVLHLTKVRVYHGEADGWQSDEEGNIFPHSHGAVPGTSAGTRALKKARNDCISPNAHFHQSN